MKHHILRLLIVFSFVLSFALPVNSQPPPPDDHGEEGNKPTGTPIGSGLLILLTLAGGYGAKKVYDARKRLQ